MLCTRRPVSICSWEKLDADRTIIKDSPVTHAEALEASSNTIQKTLVMLLSVTRGCLWDSTSTAYSCWTAAYKNEDCAHQITCRPHRSRGERATNYSKYMQYVRQIHTFGDIATLQHNTSIYMESPSSHEVQASSPASSRSPRDAAITASTPPQPSRSPR